MTQRIRSGWNAFISRDPTSTSIPLSEEMSGFGYSSRPDRVRYTKGNQRSIVASIYNRISVDVASIKIEHAKLIRTDDIKKDCHPDLMTVLMYQPMSIRLVEH